MDNNYLGVNELKALQDLINPPKNGYDSDEDLSQSNIKNLQNKPHAPKSGYDSDEDLSQSNIENLQNKPHAPLEKDKNEIWNSVDIVAQENVKIHDPRVTPEYEMKFKQSVSPEDVFLGMGFKTPGTASCEWLSILINLPGETKERIELSVETEAIDIRSEKYRLHLPTPHSIDPNSSSAKWDPETFKLELTLKLTRELDNVNF